MDRRKIFYLIVLLSFICTAANGYQIEGFNELIWRDKPTSSMVLMEKRGGFSFYLYDGMSYEFCNNEFCGVAGTIKGKSFDVVYNEFIAAYGLPGCTNPIVWFGETTVMLWNIKNEIYFVYYYTPLHKEILQHQHKKALEKCKKKKYSGIAQRK